MKNLIIIVALAFSFFSCQQQAKIGFVDNGKVINAYQEKKDVEGKYKQKDETFQKRRDSMISAYRLEYQEAQLKASKLRNQAQLQELSSEIQQKENLLTQKIQFEQQQMQQAFNAEIDSVLSKVRTFVDDYGKRNGYTYILGKNEAGSVMYGKEEQDISQAIIDELNANYKKKE
ncbi:OmpH family outer membrane protein [Ichthyenterobacterium sp. W332]|uniref:OmpH family outer membrane protein n=1 Tax=Microcosmobacter mediterraneus TaxID=3075607 RepID=A0ABU2YIN2_9FLAO|nr:OmpH family outer membrane protein [Ichthyenterobacterium sp. W332]MDT0558035.1 OmpH family outer membrane protein [Ichthyenterobacterium sp. W332]